MNIVLNTTAKKRTTILKTVNKHNVTTMLKNLNIISISVLIIYPIMLLVMLYNYALHYSLGWADLSLFLLGYYICNIAVGIGLHRLWSHDTYKAHKIVEFILVLLSAGTLQGPVLSWASNHFKHHTYTDQNDDPHSPKRYKNKLRGFLWSHIGWMLVGEGSYKSIDRLTMVKLGHNKMLRWQLKHYWILAIAMNTVVPALVGMLFYPGLQGAIAGFLFIGLGRALQQQMTFCVNSVCHFFGSQPYIKGTSRDVWWLAVFLLGENWHNFHHAFPSDYRNGVKWYHFDVHKWIIFMLSKLNLAWDLKVTSHVRITDKQMQKAQEWISSCKENIDVIYSKASDLISLCKEKKSELESASSQSYAKMLSLISQWQNRLQEMQNLLEECVHDIENKKYIISAKLESEISKIEHKLSRISSQIERRLVSINP